MTDKEIAAQLRRSRNAASMAPEMYRACNSYEFARESVHIIHHIINSINWED